MVNKNGESRLSLWLQKGYLFLCFAFLYAPIVILMIFSFNESKSRGQWTGFSFKWYQEAFHNEQILSALYNTILIAVLAAVIATIIGTIAAIGLQDLGKVSKYIALEVNYFPVINPDIVTGISLMLLFIFSKIELGFVTLLLAHISFCIPYVVLSVLPKLKQMDNNLYEAALDLGATPMYALRKVILPQIMPGVFTGMLLAFTLSLDDFVVSFFTTGNGVSNLSITIYNMVRRGVSPQINAICTVMFVTVLLLLVIINIRMNREKKQMQKMDRI